MKRILLAIALLSVAGMAYADTTITTTPSDILDKVKLLVDKTEPRGGMFFDQKDHTFHGYTAAKVLSAGWKGYTADATLGYSVDKAVLGGLETDLLADLSKIPGVKLEIPWLRVHAGYCVGYSIGTDQVSYGPTVNASVKF